jgi:hypothetical protein
MAGLPKRNTEYIFYVALTDTANRPDFKANPTIAAGDFQVSTGGGGFGNLGTLPTVTPAGGVAVKITLSNVEMDADQVVLQCIDQAGAEWDDLLVSITPTGNDVDDVKTDTANIETDTQDIQTRLPASLVGGRIDSSIGAIAASAITAAAFAIDSIDANALATDAVNEIRDAILSDSTSFAGANIDASISTRSTPAQVNTELLDVVNVDVMSELAQGLPTATPTMREALMMLYMALRNQLDVTESYKTLYDDAGTSLYKKSLSDDGTTYTEAKMETGP